MASLVVRAAHLTAGKSLPHVAVDGHPRGHSIPLPPSVWESMEMAHMGQAGPRQAWASTSLLIGWLALGRSFNLNEPQSSHL